MRAFLAAMLAASLAMSAVPAMAEHISIHEQTSGNGPLGQKWTGSWMDGWNITEWFSDVTIDGNTLSYNYLSAGSPVGTPTQLYKFGTTAAKAGELVLNIDVASNALWYGSSTNIYLWQGDIGNQQWLAGASNDQTVSKSLTFDLAQDEAWGFLIISGESDNSLSNTGPLYGSIVVTSPSASGDVPEPASLALLGLGLLGFMAARRKA